MMCQGLFCCYTDTIFSVCMDYLVKFIIFAFKFNLPIMIVKYEKQKLNRIKIVLAETEKPGKWLAEQLGRDPVTVSKWCTNSAQPDLQTLSCIARLLKVELKSLINEPESY